MKNTLSFTRLVIPFATLFILLIAFGIYYFFWVNGQRTYFLERNFRVLGGISDLVGKQVTGYTEILENVVQNDDLKKYESVDSLQRIMRETIALIPNLELYHNVSLNKISEAGRDSITIAFLSDTISLHHENESFWLHYRVSDTTTTTGSGADSLWHVQLHTRIRVADIVRPFLRRDIYDDFLVVNQNGDVIFHDTPTGIKITEINALLEKSKTMADSVLIASSSFVLDNTFAGVDYKLFFQPVQVPFYTGTTPVERESAQNKEYGLTQWTLCGMVRADRFQRESMAVSSTFIILFIFFVVLVGLSWPFLKLLLMGRNEMLGVSDVILIIFTALLGVSLVTILLLDYHFYSIHLKDTMDNQLKSFSQQIEKNFKAELSAAHGQLNIFSKAFRPQGEINRTNILQDFSFLGTYPYYDMVFWTDAAGNQKTKWTIKKIITPFLNVREREYFKALERKRYWTQRIGNESIKFYIEPIYSWNTGENLSILGIPLDTAIPFGGNSLRFAYLDTRFPSLVQPVMPEGFGFCVIDRDYRVLYHSDERRNLRENLNNECRNDRALQAAVYGRAEDTFSTNYMGSDCRFYIRPLQDIPWFAVTYYDKNLPRTANLEILSLSIELFILYELFFFFVLALIQLIRFVRFRSNPGFRVEWFWPDRKLTKCYGRLIAFYLLVICIFIASLFIFKPGVIFLIAVLAPYLTIYLTRYRLNAGLKKLEKKSGEVNKGNELNKGMEVKKGENGQKNSIEKWLPFRWAYAAAAFLLVIITGVLPSLGFFTIASHTEMELFIKHGQFSLARALEERARQVEDKYQNIKMPDQKSFILKRLYYKKEDVYDGFFFDTNWLSRPWSPLPDSTNSNYETRFKNILIQYFRPLYNQAALETRGISYQSSPDNLWNWIHKNDDILALHRKATSGESRDLYITSRLPSLPPYSYLSISNNAGYILWLSGCLLFIIFIFLMVRFIAQRIFILNLEEPPEIDAHYYHEVFKLLSEEKKNTRDEKGKAEFQNLLVITSDPSWEIEKNPRNVIIDIVVETKQKAKEKSDVEGHNQKGIESSGESLEHLWPENRKTNDYKDAQVIVIKHFEYKLDNSDHNRQKLHLMEKLLYTLRAPIIVFSTVDPMFYITTGGGILREPECEEPLLPQDKIRWAHVFGSFARIHLREEGDPKAFEEPLKSLVSEKIPLDSSEIARISEIGDIIKKECSHDARLQEIGKEILKLPKHELMDSSSEQLIFQVLYWSDTHYLPIWYTCSLEERNVVYGLAKYGYVNSKNMRVIKRLLRRGLLKRTPALRIMNESFRRYVLASIQPEDIRAWKKGEERSAWSALKFPLIVLLGSIALFLYVTQPRSFNYITAFLTTFAVGMPAITRILSAFQEDRTKTAG